MLSNAGAAPWVSAATHALAAPQAVTEVAAPQVVAASQVVTACVAIHRGGGSSGGHTKRSTAVLPGG